MENEIIGERRKLKQKTFYVVVDRQRTKAWPSEEYSYFGSSKQENTSQSPTLFYGGIISWREFDCNSSKSRFLILCLIEGSKNWYYFWWLHRWVL